MITMTWLSAAVGLIWLLMWLLLTAKAAASRDGESSVKMFSSALPAFVVTSLLAAYAAFPMRGQMFRLVLWVHHTAFFSLFLFLLGAQFFQAQIWWQIRRGAPAASVAETMRHFWVLSEIAPAPIALAIFLTGLRLIWESPVANAPAASWLLVIILSFSAFFFDGIFGYQPIVRRMRLYWERATQQGIPTHQAAERWHATSDCLQLLLHCLSWPFVFAFGVFRWSVSNPLSALVERLQHDLAFLPVGWPGVVAAVVLWGLMGLLVVLTRTLFRRRVRIRSNLSTG
jgi:hypothetical protein